VRSLGNLELSDRNSPLASTIAIISCFVVKLLSTTVQASDQEQHKVKEQTCTQNKLLPPDDFMSVAPAPLQLATIFDSRPPSVPTCRQRSAGAAYGVTY
jgi:hypothetical protein